MKVLVVGATGSIGHLAVEEAIRQGHTVPLLRDTKKARRLPAGTGVVVGDLTRVETLAAAVDGVDAIVFTHGSDGGGKAGAERIDYGGVRNVLAALGGRSVRVALMTAIGVTNREGDYNRRTEALEGSVAKRAGTPDEVGAVGALLMGPDGGFITGSDFLMDGGVTAAYWYGDVGEVRT
jgi:uncharacterized protein YbjT (DUF2867 family)